MSFPFRTVAFDLDGTLVDSAPDLATALNLTLADLGRPCIPLDQVVTMIGNGARTLLRRGLNATGACDDRLIEHGYPLFMHHYADNICNQTLPYPGVEAALDALSDLGVTLALCTNKPEAPARTLINALGWQSRFAAIVGGDTAKLKPDPAPLLLAIAQSGGGPAAFVGDSAIDVQTARAADIRCVVVSFGFAQDPVADLGADAVIDSFDALIPALNNLARR